MKIGVSITISNKTQVNYRYTICKSGLVTINPLLWFYTDVKVDLSNDFSISLAATVEFTDSNDDIHGIIDITDEVEYIMDINKDGQNKFANAITGSDLCGHFQYSAWSDSPARSRGFAYARIQRRGFARRARRFIRGILSPLR